MNDTAQREHPRRAIPEGVLIQLLLLLTYSDNIKEMCPATGDVA